MEAFENAINKGFKIIETDIQITKDKKLVVFHDLTLDRLTNTKGLGWAFLSCIFFILGMPIVMLLAIEGSAWYEAFSLMNPMF